MDVLFQIQYEWDKEIIYLYYQTRSREVKKRIICLAVICGVFTIFLNADIWKGIVISMIIFSACVVILADAILPRLSTHIHMKTTLNQYGKGIRIMTIKKDEIDLLFLESRKRKSISFIEIMEIGTIKEYCWIRVINQLIFFNQDNFVIGDMGIFVNF